MPAALGGHRIRRMALPNTSGCHPRCGIRFFRFHTSRSTRWLRHITCLLVLTFSTLASAQPLDEVLALSKAGASGLALELLNQQQPAFVEDAAGWQRWERSRIEIMAAQQQWQPLVERLQAIPTGVSAEFARWASGWQARALIELRQGEAARRLLRRLLWQEPGSGEDERMLWRRLVVQSYRADGRGEDAYAAMLRYRHDYGRGGREDALLSAQVLLGQGRAADAVDALLKHDDIDSRSLLLLARLRSSQWEPRRVLREVRQLLRDKGLSYTQRQQLQATAAEAALASGDWAAQAIALEQVFSLARLFPPDPELFSLTPDMLWEAYLGYARTVGNQEQLLIGDDVAWLAVAQTTGRMYPIRVRSIYALLALHGQEAGTRSSAHIALVQQLLQQEDGTELLRQLYLSASRFADLKVVPAGVRHALLDPVLSTGDLRLASRLLAGLDEPPAGADRVMWRLRQAKVFVLAGDYPKASTVLQSMVADSTNLSRDELDRLIQVLFDLQTVGEHDSAYALFAALQRQVSDVQLKRELWYWMGDSRMAQSRPVEAAALYLRSALSIGPQAMDPWAQTARYQAAQALAKAGLRDDARVLYEQLLAATDEPARRAVLRRDMQQLLVARP